MNTSPYDLYLITNRLSSGRYTSIEATLDNMSSLIDKNTIDISVINRYEIYTCHPKTGEGGWEIQFVRSTDNLIKQYPFFDEIITKNDTRYDVDYLCYQTVLNNGQ